ncbi:MAG: NlpC/P60 family protein [Prosthecobacter sp.]
MPLFPRLLTLLLLTAGTAHVPAATTSSSKSKSKSKASTSSSSKSKSGTTSQSGTNTSAKSKSEDSSSAKPDTPAEKKAEQAVVKEDTPKPPRPAAVSTMSIEEIRDFDKYPKQVQSLVQSALALTHLELRYMYGSHEPLKGGMDCSGTMYHLLHFQGLKDVPRQSDEMAMWVERKSQLHLTPTATDFDSPEFADLKPGDLLFWTNTTATTRKLPVTHVMVYLGKRKKDGKRIIFGSSDGRSFSGMRRSGVSVFDFHLPRAEGTARLHGYGPAPGLLPQEMVLASTTTPKPATPPVTPAPAVTSPTKEEPKKEPAKVVAAAPEMKAQEETPKEAATPLYVRVKKDAPKPEPTIVSSTNAAKMPPAPVVMETKEEVRKAVAVVSENDGTGEEASSSTGPSKSDASESKELTDTAKAEPKKVASSSSSKPKPTTSSKPKSSTSTKKKSVQVSSRRRTPAPPPKSRVEQAFDRAVNSVRRAFR